MTDPYRYFPEKPLPPYIFVPGENPHPKKRNGHMEGEEDPVAEPLDPAHPEASWFLRYALDLLNYGYFWESHVYFEALWNAHGRTGATADFLKALIKVGAAGVKVKVGQLPYAEEHLDRALELLEKVQNETGDSFLGFDIKALKAVISEARMTKSFKFVFHPSWK